MNGAIRNDRERANAVDFIRRGRWMIDRYPEHREFFEEVIADVETDIAEFDGEKKGPYEQRENSGD
jgi:hypothetical protein